MPGLFDGHVHGVRCGLTFDHEVRWGSFRRLEDGLDAIMERGDSLGEGAPVVTIGGWQQAQLAERRMPTTEELDHVAPRNPVFVQAGYEQAVLNTLAARIRAEGVAEFGPALTADDMGYVVTGPQRSERAYVCC